MGSGGVGTTVGGAGVGRVASARPVSAPPRDGREAPGGRATGLPVGDLGHCGTFASHAAFMSAAKSDWKPRRSCEGFASENCSATDFGSVSSGTTG